MGQKEPQSSPEAPREPSAPAGHDNRLWVWMSGVEESRTDVGDVREHIHTHSFGLQESGPPRTAQTWSIWPLGAVPGSGHGRVGSN